MWNFQLLILYEHKHNCFYMNINIEGDFQIFISVPLTFNFS